MKKILLNDRNGGTVIYMHDIIYCEAQNCYSVFYLMDGNKIMVCKTLKEFEKSLCEKSFIRVHRKYIVNMDYVKSYVRKQNSKVRMTNNTVLEIAVRRKKEFFCRFSRHITGKHPHSY